MCSKFTKYTANLVNTQWIYYIYSRFTKYTVSLFNVQQIIKYAGNLPNIQCIY